MDWTTLGLIGAGVGGLWLAGRARARAASSAASSSEGPWSPPPAAAPFLAAIAAAERQNAIPHNLFARLLEQESSYRPEVISGEVKSSAGAVGIAQLVPKFHPDVDPTNPYDAIPYAAHYLRQQFDAFGSWAKALAAYNYGPTRLRREAGSPLWLHRLPFETQHYVREILADVPIEEQPA